MQHNVEAMRLQNCIDVYKDAYAVFETLQGTPSGYGERLTAVLQNLVAAEVRNLCQLELLLG